MKDDLQKLQSLRLAYREGGDLRVIIDGVIAIARSSSPNSTALTDVLTELKHKVNQLARGFLDGTIDSNAYTLAWDQVVRDTMKTIDLLEQVMVDEDVKE